MTEEAGTETEPKGTGEVTPEAGKQDTQTQQDGTTPKVEGGATDPFAELDADTREWLGKRNAKTPAEVAKLAREQASLLGNAVRVPGEKATEEERNEFLNKLGRPATADAYDFKVPDKLPENLPYDGERATSFKTLAHGIGLTQKQAAAVHDWAVENAVADFTGAETAQKAKQAEIAKAETEKLVKRWGPMDGETAKANLAYADKAIRETGGEAMVEALKRWGLMTADGVIQDETIAVSYANIGMALYKEDTILPGSGAVAIGNPFEDGPNFNMTKQMQLVKADRDHALSLIAAAGKKPSDFGLAS